VRLVLPIEGKRALVVSDDPVLVIDPFYDPGAKQALRAAWRRGDYYYVELIGHDGKVIDAVHGMAGYGSPRKAAIAALNDFWGGE
jgi:hypothetical protein